MKKLGIYLGVLSSLISATASAGDMSVLVYCTVSTRGVAGHLRADINLETGYLSYNFDKYHATVPAQNYVLSGNNQEGFGASVLSSSEVFFTVQHGARLKITAIGKYFDRATYVGKDEIEIVLKKESFGTLGEFSLVSFQVNGVRHELDGPSFCRYE